MKTNLRALGTRDLKPILAYFKEQWGAEFEFPWAWYQSTKNDLFVLSKDVTKINAQQLRINSVGLYVGEYKNHEIRLSIEGSQLIGPHAKKNVLELNSKDFLRWLKGEDMETKEPSAGFVIIKSGDDFAGCGKVKEGRLLNFVPKARRLLVTPGAQEGQ